MYWLIVLYVDNDIADPSVPFTRTPFRRSSALRRFPPLSLQVDAFHILLTDIVYDETQPLPDNLLPHLVLALQHSTIRSRHTWQGCRTT